MKKKFPICTLNHLYEYSIKELPSERFYQWLDDYFISIPQYYGDCNKLSDPYKDNEKIKRLCKKVVKYIKSKPFIPNIKHLKDHHCNLFNYWIYEQLVSYYENNSREPFHIFGNFLAILSELEPNLKDNKCTLDFNITMIQDREKIKKLYGYCVDYKSILENYKHSKEKCTKYHTYVQEKIQLYEEYQSLCASGDKINCPDYYEKLNPPIP
ncbi:variable surface protein Vir16, putative, truncated, partial [Plasmodium vivax]